MSDETKTPTPAAMVKAVNAQIKEQEKEQKTELGYGPYKTEDIAEFAVHGERINVIMADFRKFTVSL